jgi:hypothetical protein
MKASVAPIKKRIENNIILFDDKEKVKHDIQFNKSIREHTLLGPNLENIILTNILAKESPK